MRYWWCRSLGVVDARLEVTERREHLDSLNFSFQLVLHEDTMSRSDCNMMQSYACGERISLRHLVSLAKRNELEWFREDDRSFIYIYIYKE